MHLRLRSKIFPSKYLVMLFNIIKNSSYIFPCFINKQPLISHKNMGKTYQAIYINSATVIAGFAKIQFPIYVCQTCRPSIQWLNVCLLFCHAWISYNKNIMLYNWNTTIFVSVWYLLLTGPSVTIILAVIFHPVSLVFSNITLLPS